METKEIEISKDYYIFLMKDILERLKTITINEEKDNDLFSCVYIQNPYFRHGLETVYLEKADNKVIYYSEVIVCSNFSYMTGINFIILDKFNNVIGSSPAADEETIKVVNKLIKEDHIEDHLNVFHLINWKIEFKLNETKLNIISVNLCRSDLSEVGIDLKSVNTFIHNSIANEINSSLFFDKQEKCYYSLVNEPEDSV